MIQEKNPLLYLKQPKNQMIATTHFSAIKPIHVKPAMDFIMKETKKELKKLYKIKSPTFKNFVVPFSDIEEKLDRVWGIIHHLTSVKDSPSLRKVFNELLPQVSSFYTDIEQNKTLVNNYLTIKKSPTFKKLNKIEQKIINDKILNFKLSGALLTDDKQKIYKKLKKKLSLLSAKFSENVLDDINEYKLIITDKKDLAGLPKDTIASAYKKTTKGDSWVFTLQMPSYIPFMQFSKNSKLRKQLYLAQMTKATQRDRDNTPIINKILKLKKELSQLLGFKNYAELSLVDKMAKSPSSVLKFLNNLQKKSFKQAQEEIESLKSFQTQKTDLNSWDFSYLSTIQKKKLFNFTDEDIKPYFPEEKVFAGLLTILKKLWGISAEKTKINTWNKDVKVYNFFDVNGDFIGIIYFDLYARKSKRSGAWMNDYLTRKINPNQSIQFPAAYVVCNFDSPTKQRPSLFSHNDLTTLFHEMGHALHHILSKVDYRDVSGISGVPWDGVELPSQFLENWCWEESALGILSGHYKTGKKLPKKLIKNLKKSKNYLSAYQMNRQLEFSIFDMSLHSKFSLEKESVQEFLTKQRKKMSVIIPPPETRFQNSFSHIFAGGYAAGYYSYKWAEVLAADCFSKFEEDGIFNKKTSDLFRNTFLSQGGSKDFMTLFKNFRGRKPSIEALIRHSGIKSK